MNRYQLSATLLATILPATIAVAAHADIRSDLSMATGTGSGSSLQPKAQASFTTYVKGNAERDETLVTSPVALRLAVLLLPDQDKYVYLDPNLKICSICPLSEAPPDQMGIPSIQNLFFGHKSPGTTGTLTSTITVKDLGMEMAPDAKKTGHHYTVTSHRVATGAAGTSDTTSSSDVWIDPSLPRPTLKALRDTPRIYTTPSGAKITYTVTGDVDAFNSLENFLPIEVKVGGGTGIASSLVISQTAVSSDPQDAALFEIPSDYKQMPLPNFVDTEMNAILDSIAGPQPKLAPQTGK